MAGKKRPGEKAPSAILEFGVEEGQDVRVGDPGWTLVTIPVGSILEVSLQGCSIGLGTDDWFALLVTEVIPVGADGTRVGGKVLGCESESHLAELVGALTSGYVHLCSEDPCAANEAEDLVHATCIRLWRLATFEANYLSKGGKALLTKSKNAALREATKAPRGTSAGPKRKPAGKVSTKRTRPADTAIEISEGEEADSGERAEPNVSHAALRGLLKETRERILGGGEKRRRTTGEASSGGAGDGRSSAALGENRLVAGTALRPGHMTPLSLAQSEGTNEGGVRKLKKRLETRSDARSQLLAQALQAGDLRESEMKNRREKSNDRQLQKLKEMLEDQLKQKKKKSRRRSRGRSRRRRDDSRSSGRRMKPDPDGGPGDSGSGGSSTSSRSSRRRRRRRDRSESDSDLSYEPPLRRKATKSPGSVLEMLVKHAQDQMDRGALLEGEGASAGATSGIKIGSYFALLIRPYYSHNSPLVRELYALAQAIDLLRAGRLPETGDALASRFIAVHTALGDGGWQTASQLELFPLEPVQSATVSTMLQAQRHRRLVQKSQGYVPSRWTGSGAGKGKPNSNSWSEKGKKGDLKGRGRGKGKGQNKSNQWGKKPEENPWKENQEDPGKK
eukprot:s163_g23.t1